MKNSQSIRSLFALPGFVVAGLKGLFGMVTDTPASSSSRGEKNSCVLLLWATVPGAL